MLTTNEVAQEMGVAYTTVMLWIKQGKLEAVKREHPRGDYYEIPASALKRLDRGSKGRPRKDGDDEAHVVSADSGTDDQATTPTDEAPAAKPAKKAKKKSK